MNSKASPDLILHNGRITTLDRNCPEATNLAVKDGRIVGVNDAEEYEPGPNTKVIDLKGRRVIPGLNDSLWYFHGESAAPNGTSPGWPDRDSAAAMAASSMILSRGSSFGFRNITTRRGQNNRNRDWP